MYRIPIWFCILLHGDDQVRKMAGSASAILGFASMFAAGIVSPLVGIGGDHTGVPMGITMLVCAVLSLLCLYGLVEKE